MSEKSGKLITCDRCGETLFLKYTGEVGLSNYAGPGTRSTYEDLPKTWMHNSGFGHLCPFCAGVFVRWLKEFFGEDKYEKFAPVWKVEEEPCSED